MITATILVGLAGIVKADEKKDKSEIIQFMNSSEADSIISKGMKVELLKSIEEGDYDLVKIYIEQAKKEEKLFRLVRSELDTLNIYIKKGQEGNAIDLIITIKGQLNNVPDFLLHPDNFQNFYKNFFFLVQ